MGFKPIIVPESATLIFKAAGRPDFSDRDRTYNYQRAIIRTQLNLEDTFLKLAQQEPNSVIITDRGTIDSKAFMDPEDWKRLLNEVGTSEIELRDKRYDAVIHMVTAAEGVPEYYKLDDVRTETPQQAIVQDHRLRAAYLGHSHHKIIDNSGTFENKVHRVELEICRILGVPDPLEIERKFLIPTPPSTLPDPHVSSDIVQIYLDTGRDEELRIRQRSQDGHSVYTMSRKKKIELGIRIEKEEFLTNTEFQALSHRGKGSLTKRRHCFIHNGRCYELDEYTGKNAGLWVLEVEVENIDDPVSLPDWASNAIDVTANEKYSNASLIQP
jgi:CYTH domain-containing protein/predicted ATPase